MSRVLLGCLLSFMLAISVMGAAEANAAEGGGLYVKIEPFTVNLHGLTLFLQITMTLKVANPALVETVKSNMPIILNALTCLLSDQDASRLESPDGKQMLVQQARHAINKALSLTSKNGVTGVFLENMVIE